MNSWLLHQARASSLERNEITLQILAENVSRKMEIKFLTQIESTRLWKSRRKFFGKYVIGFPGSALLKNELSHYCSFLTFASTSRVYEKLMSNHLII